MKAKFKNALSKLIENEKSHIKDESPRNSVIGINLPKIDSGRGSIMDVYDKAPTYKTVISDNFNLFDVDDSFNKNILISALIRGRGTYSDNKLISREIEYKSVLNFYLNRNSKAILDDAIYDAKKCDIEIAYHPININYDLSHNKKKDNVHHILYNFRQINMPWDVMVDIVLNCAYDSISLFGHYLFEKTKELESILDEDPNAYIELGCIIPENFIMDKESGELHLDKTNVMKRNMGRYSHLRSRMNNPMNVEIGDISIFIFGEIKNSNDERISSLNIFTPLNDEYKKTILNFIKYKMKMCLKRIDIDLIYSITHSNSNDKNLIRRALDRSYDTYIGEKEKLKERKCDRLIMSI